MESVKVQHADESAIKLRLCKRTFLKVRAIRLKCLSNRSSNRTGALAGGQVNVCVEDHEAD
jgi:hypothetical protein